MKERLADRRTLSKRSITKQKMAGEAGQEAQVFGVSLKQVSLVLLVFQNVSLVLSIKLTRERPAPDGLAYLSSTVVVMSEVFKLVASFAIELWLESDGGRKLEIASAKMKSQFVCRDTILLSVPGILYCFQNNLLFVALTNLSVAVYQVSAQSKLLTTAMFSVLMLGKRLSKEQIASLVMLAAGVGIVQLSAVSGGSSDSGVQNQVLGMAALLTACMTSGFAGVYFEKILKGSQKVSLFMRNIQLAFFGVVIGIATAFVSDGAEIQEAGFFQGYSFLLWIVITIQALGGLLIAVVIKYADNILKGFATSISIVVATMLSVVFMNKTVRPMFVVGAALVITSVMIYNKYPPKPIVESPPTYKEVSQRDNDLEKA